MTGPQRPDSSTRLVWGLGPKPRPLLTNSAMSLRHCGSLMAAGRGRTVRRSQATGLPPGEPLNKAHSTDSRRKVAKIAKRHEELHREQLQRDQRRKRVGPKQTGKPKPAPTSRRKYP